MEGEEEQRPWARVTGVSSHVSKDAKISYYEAYLLIAQLGRVEIKRRRKKTQAFIGEPTIKAKGSKVK